jgi:hypothetical protein
MKISLLTYLCSLALALTAFGQTPTVSPTATATASVATTTAAVAPSASVSATPNDADDDIARTVHKKLKHHMGVTVGGHKDLDFGDDDSAGALMAIPIVGIVFTTLFGAPVMIVAAIMFFSYLKSRSLHRTVRMMVEKGQPVPPELFATPGTRIKTRSDLRRGVILITIGVGLIIFFGAVSDWESGGPWVIGVIPFLIGAAYLALGKLETAKRENNTLRDDRPIS